MIQMNPELCNDTPSGSGRSAAQTANGAARSTTQKASGGGRSEA